jgi:hypothetical protein
VATEKRNNLGFQIFTAVTMNNFVFWDIKKVLNSQEKHYFSSKENGRLKFCKISGFHGGYQEECRLLGYKGPIHTLQGDITSLLHSPAGESYVRFKIFRAEPLKNIVFGM